MAATISTRHEELGASESRVLARLRALGRSLYTVLLAILFPLAIIAPVGGTWENYKRNANPTWLPMGLAIDATPSKVYVGAALSNEARRSGLSAGDHITAIDGRAMPAVDPAAVVRPWLEAKREGEAVQLAVRTAEGAFETVQLTHRERHLTEPFEATGLNRHVVIMYNVIFGLIPPVFMIVAALLLLRRRNEAVPALFACSLLLLSAAAFEATAFWSLIQLPMVGVRLQSLGWSSLLLVILLFPSGRLDPPWTRWLAAVIGLWAIVDFSVEMPGPFVNSITLILMAGGLVGLWSRYRRLSPGFERQQLRWAFLGFAIGASGFAIITLLQWVRRANADDLALYLWLPIFMEPLSTAAIAIFVGGLIVSLLRYRLYDVDAAISRSAAVAALTLALAAVYAGSSEVLTKYFEASFGRSAGAWPSAIGAALAVLLFVPLNGRVQAWAERRFQSGLAHLRRDLPECVSDLRETARASELVEEVLHRVATGVRASRAALVLDGAVAGVREIDRGEVESWLHQVRLDGACEEIETNRSDHSFPVRMKLCVRHGRSAEPVGWLLLGPRPDGSFYGKDERETLAEVIDPVARALQIVQLREADEAEREQRFQRIEDRLAEALASLARAGSSAKGVSGAASA